MAIVQIIIPSESVEAQSSTKRLVKTAIIIKYIVLLQICCCCCNESIQVFLQCLS